jgi:hypothetical protein
MPFLSPHRRQFLEFQRKTLKRVLDVGAFLLESRVVQEVEKQNVVVAVSLGGSRSACIFSVGSVPFVTRLGVTGGRWWALFVSKYCLVFESIPASQVIARPCILPRMAQTYQKLVSRSTINSPTSPFTSQCFMQSPVVTAITETCHFFTFSKDFTDLWNVCNLQRRFV